MYTKTTVTALLKGKCEMVNGKTVTANEARQELTEEVVRAMIKQATEERNVDAARWLEEYAKDALPLQDMLTPIIVAAKKGNVDAVRWLKEHELLNLDSR